MDGRVILSVVIPTCNKRLMLDRTLEALLSSGGDPGCAWEIVIADDGSTDGTAESLDQWEQEAPSGRLTVVSAGRNLGRAKARNLAAGAASGQWLLFLDDDIVAPPGLLAAHLSVLRGKPDNGTIGVVVTDPELVDAPHFHYLDRSGVARATADRLPAKYFVTQNAAVGREAFLKVGGFDETFSGYGFEDMELAFRLEEQAGVIFRAVREPVPLHVHHHTLNEYLDKKTECGRQSLQHLADLHPARIREMHLDWLLDVPGQPKKAGAGLLRGLLRGGAGRWIEHLANNWPTTTPSSPRFAALYFKLMDGVILRRYLAGLTNS